MESGGSSLTSQQPLDLVYENGDNPRHMEITTLAALIVAGILIAIGYLAWRASGELIHPAHRAPSCTPEQFGLRCEGITFQAPNGPLLRGWWIPTALMPKGTIILSHGYTGDCSPDLTYAPDLNRAGYNVCLFDYRGHGASDGNYTSLVYYERQDLIASIQLLESRGIERIGLLGFSMGGAIALATAPHCPGVVGVISDCSFGKLQAILENAARKRGVPGVLAPALAWMVELFASLRLRANLFASDPIRWVAKISPRPVLIMHGEADADVPVEQAYRLYDTAHEPKEIWVVAGARHREIEQVAEEEYRHRVIAFFDRAFASQ